MATELTMGASEAFWYNRELANPVLQVVVFAPGSRDAEGLQLLTLSDGLYYFEGRLASSSASYYLSYSLELGCLIRLKRFCNPVCPTAGARELAIDEYEVVSRPKELLGNPQPVTILPPRPQDVPAPSGPEACLSDEAEGLLSRLLALKSSWSSDRQPLEQAVDALRAQLLKERREQQAAQQQAQRLLLSAIDTSDVTVRSSDGHCIPTRRAVLSRAEVLQRMLASPLSEGQAAELELPNVDGLSLRYLIAALQTGPDAAVPLPAEPERLGLLVELATFYGIPWLATQAVDALPTGQWDVDAELSPLVFLGIAEKHLASDDDERQRAVWERAQSAAVSAIGSRLEDALVLPDFANVSLGGLDRIARALGDAGAAGPWLSCRGRAGESGAVEFDAEAFHGAFGADGDVLDVHIRGVPPHPVIDGCCIFAARVEVQCEGQALVVATHEGALCSTAQTLRTGFSGLERRSRLKAPAPDEYVLKVRLAPLERQCRAIMTWARGNLPGPPRDLVGTVMGLAGLGPDAAALQPLVSDYIARAFCHLDRDRLCVLPAPLLRHIIEQDAVNTGARGEISVAELLFAWAEHPAGPGVGQEATREVRGREGQRDGEGSGVEAGAGHDSVAEEGKAAGAKTTGATKHFRTHDGGDGEALSQGQGRQEDERRRVPQEGAVVDRWAQLPELLRCLRMQFISIEHWRDRARAFQYFCRHPDFRPLFLGAVEIQAGKRKRDQEADGRSRKRVCLSSIPRIANPLEAMFDLVASAGTSSECP